MSVVASKYCVNMDSGVKDAIVVQLENNQEIKFTCCSHGLYYFDIANAIPVDIHQDKITENKTIDRSKISFTSYSFVSTIYANK